MALVTEDAYSGLGYLRCPGIANGHEAIKPYTPIGNLPIKQYRYLNHTP